MSGANPSGINSPAIGPTLDPGPPEAFLAATGNSQIKFLPLPGS